MMVDYSGSFEHLQVSGEEGTKKRNENILMRLLHGSSLGPQTKLPAEQSARPSHQGSLYPRSRDGV